MPAGHSVRPHKWSNVIDLYDDGTNSAIWGSYEQSTTRCLGVRWNDDYPNQGGNSLWYVEPDFVTKNILLELLSRVNNNPSVGNVNNILLALREYQP
jgi:hypothetical protein